MMYQPPSAARTDYSPYMRNVALLPAYPDGDVLTGPGSADDDPGVGHRSSRRPGGLRRLPHRRPPRETKNAGLDAGLTRAIRGQLNTAPRTGRRAPSEPSRPSERSSPASPGARPGPAQRPPSTSGWAHVGGAADTTAPAADAGLRRPPGPPRSRSGRRTLRPAPGRSWRAVRRSGRRRHRTGAREARLTEADRRLVLSVMPRSSAGLLSVGRSTVHGHRELNVSRE